MATLGSYYIDSTDFTTATGVYTDIDLTIAAPALPQLLGYTLT